MNKVNIKIIVLIASYFLVFGYFSQLSEDNSRISLGTPILKNFKEVTPGNYMAAGEAFHEIAIPVLVENYRYYEVEYKVNDSPENIVSLTSDLIGNNYDNENQDENRVINQNIIGKKIKFIKNSENSSGNVFLRFFYTGKPGLNISSINIKYVNYYYEIVIILSIFTILFFSKSKIIKYLKEKTGKNSDKLTYVVLLVLSAIRFFIYLRTPYWGGDEYAYKTIATWIFHRHSYAGMTSEVFADNININNLLFPYIGSFFIYFGDSFLFIAKLYNAICIFISSLIIYNISKLYIEKIYALAISILILLIPFNAIGAFFVTEPTFFLALTLCFYVFIKIKDVTYWQAFAVGVLTFFLSNIRPNGFIFTAAYLIYLSFPSPIKIRKRIIPALLSIITYFTISYIVKIIFYQNSYQDIYDNFLNKFSLNSFGRIFSIDFANLLYGHIFSIAYLYSLPIISIINYIYSKGPKDINLLKAVKFGFSIFIAGLMTAIGFTFLSSLFDIGGLGRWHVRYYYYTFPFLIFGFFVTCSKLNKIPRIIIYILQVAIIFLIYFGFKSSFINNIWFSSAVDNIDNQWVVTINYFKYFLIFSLILLFLWINYSKDIKSIKIIYFIFASIVMLAGNYGSRNIYRSIDEVTLGVNRIAGIPYNFFGTQCGLFARDYFGYYPGSYIVIGSDRSKVVSVNFWLNSLPIETKIIPPQSKLSSILMNTLSHPRYIVVNGPVINDKYREILSIGECKILATEN